MSLIRLRSDISNLLSTKNNPSPLRGKGLLSLTRDALAQLRVKDKKTSPEPQAKQGLSL
jgi:hypothetical protein